MRKFEYKSGDILAEDAEALVNTVNCVGVMGRGIALQFKDAFPENFEAYAAACERGELTRLLHKLICIGARNASVQVVFRTLDGPVHVHSQ